MKLRSSARDVEKRNDDAMTRLSESGRIKIEWRILYSVMRNQDGERVSRVEEAGSLRLEPVLVVIDYVTMPRGGPPRWRTRRERRGPAI